jgi:hypothetical protein
MTGEKTARHAASVGRFRRVQDIQRKDVQKIGTDWRENSGWHTAAPTHWSSDVTRRHSWQKVGLDTPDIS